MWKQNCLPCVSTVCDSLHFQRKMDRQLLLLYPVQNIIIAFFNYFPFWFLFYWIRNLLEYYVNCITRNSAHVFIRSFLDILDVGSDDLSKKNNSTSAPCLLAFYSEWQFITSSLRQPGFQLLSGGMRDTICDHSNSGISFCNVLRSFQRMTPTFAKGAVMSPHNSSTWGRRGRGHPSLLWYK